jgi:chemotaxis protein CheX
VTIEAITPVLPSQEELAELVEEVWRSFLDDDIVVGLESPDDPERTMMVAWVSITGEWTGHLQVLTTPDGAKGIASSMFQMDAAEISSEEVADAFGEIANMVGGGVKGMVGVHTALSLPQVVLDSRALISPEAHQHSSIQAVWRGEPLQFSLWERGPKTEWNNQHNNDTAVGGA